MVQHVWFAHGKESGPWGRKITALAELARHRGLTVESPDYSFTMNPDERVDHLLSLNPPAGDDLVLVGSSMGGYVTAAASRTLRPAGLFLMAPAVDIPGYDGDTTPVAGRTETVHGWRDALIPPETVVSWSRRHATILHLIDAEHTLNERLDDVVSLFAGFLNALDNHGT